MITGNEPIHPSQFSAAEYDFTGMPVLSEKTFYGLKLRQHFAAMAMQGMLSACRGYDNKALENLASCAVQQADALIAELNKTQ